MKKFSIPIIVGISVAIAVGIVYAGMFIEEPFIGNTQDKSNDNNQPEMREHPNAIKSGPLTITKYDHKVAENIFLIVSGLTNEDKGNIRVFMPDGRLYKTYEYDGSIKNNFNSYFKPDTSVIRKICEQDELVGKWKVIFDNNAYPPLEFEIINEHLSGPDVRLPKAC